MIVLEPRKRAEHFLSCERHKEIRREEARGAACFGQLMRTLNDFALSPAVARVYVSRTTTDGLITFQIVVLRLQSLRRSHTHYKRNSTQHLRMFPKGLSFTLRITRVLEALQDFGITQLIAIVFATLMDVGSISSWWVQTQAVSL